MTNLTEIKAAKASPGRRRRSSRTSGTRQAIRTNNDLESWHRALNYRAQRGNIQFYLLIKLLFNEARMMPVEVQLLSQGVMRRVQRTRYRGMQAKYFKYWREFRSGIRSVDNLLNAVSGMNGPH